MPTTSVPSIPVFNSVRQPFVNHRCGDFIAALLRIFASDVCGHNYREILYRREPHHNVPHRIGAVMHQCDTACPEAFECHPTEGVFTVVGGCMEFDEHFWPQQTAHGTALHMKNREAGEVIK